MKLWYLSVSNIMIQPYVRAYDSIFKMIWHHAWFIDYCVFGLVSLLVQLLLSLALFLFHSEFSWFCWILGPFKMPELRQEVSCFQLSSSRMAWEGSTVITGQIRPRPTSKLLSWHCNTQFRANESSASYFYTRGLSSGSWLYSVYCLPG